jgi:APA family basic amino acid/polyamine antiporter
MRLASQRKIGWGSAAALVVANMVGTGVFTSLGMQLQWVSSPVTIALLWTLGGIISLFGAFSYAELGAKLPRSGGEYYFLSQIYHPFLGYLSGWVSLTVGFAASVALSAMGMGAYLEHFLPQSAFYVAIAAILLISLVHSIDIQQSSRFQNAFTVLKLLLILSFILVCFLVEPAHSEPVSGASWQSELLQPAFAVLLVYVVYAYSGWNAAVYIVEEIEAPTRNLPRALIGGTLVVSVLYVLLQLAFMYQAPVSGLQGRLDVGQVVAQLLFGHWGGKLISFFVALFLVSSISAMVWVGPRVVRAMADDYRIWHFLARDNKNGVPVRAIWLQAAISIFMIATSSFEQVLVYSGFVLQLFTIAAVGGIFVLRWKNGHEGYSSPGYPWVQIVFLIISFAILVFLLYERPVQSLWGLVNLALGAISYFVSRGYAKLKMKSSNGA